MKQNRIKQIVLGSAMISILASATAQNEVDALRYSRSTFGGTARFTAMSGAFGALGGDISSLSFNPAGIAIYRKSEFTITPSVFGQLTTSTYNNTSTEDSRMNFNIGNVGIIGTQLLHNKEEKGWISVNFGFGYNRLNSFHNRTEIRGENSGSSLLHTFLESANGLTPGKLDPFSDRLAFDVFLIDTISGPTTYGSAIPSGSLIEQVKSIESRGSMGETVISFGGNYSNRLYLGASMGFPTIRYYEESSYSEYDRVDSIKTFQSFTYNNDFTSRGAGFNFKFGMIFRITDWARIGGAVHSPSFFSMTDNYGSSMAAYYDGFAPSEASSDPGEFNYRLTTPMRAIGSLGFVIGKSGLLGIDFEQVDYASARLNSSPNEFFDVNKSIREKYTVASNIRAGLEWRLDPVSFRGGYAYYGSPYEKGVNSDASRTSYTAGIGIRDEDYFLDFTYVYTRYGENYYLYTPSKTISINPAQNTFQSSAFMVTLGFKY